MLLYGKRLSRDRVMNEDIRKIAGDRLKISPFSASLFPGIQPDSSFLRDAGDDDYCFVENEPLLPWADQISEMIVYCWNRDYPATTFLDLVPSAPEWKLASEKDFQGSSHDRITRKIYVREYEEK